MNGLHDDVDEPPGIRIDQLQGDDKVLVFGRVIRVVAVRAVEGAPNVSAVTIRATDSDRDVEAVLPADWQLIAVDAPRTIPLPCMVCGATALASINLARTVPRRSICRDCDA